MLKSSQVVLASLFFALCGCGGYGGSITQTETPNENPPATQADIKCAPQVEAAIVQVAEARTTEDKSSTTLQMASCDVIDAAVKPEVQTCATKFGEKIDLKKEVETCRSLIVEREQILVQKQTQRPIGEKPQQTAKAESTPEATAVPEALKVESRGLLSYDKLRLRDWVYVPDQKVFGHVVSEKMAGTGDITVRLSHKVDGKTEHVPLSKNQLVMPIAVGSLQLCDQNEQLDRDAMVSTQKGNIYKIRAAFDGGPIIASLQGAPVGLKSYFPRTRLVDKDPIVLNKEEITGLPVDCINGMCVGDQVMSIIRPDLGRRFIAEKIFCDGTMLLSTDAWVTRSEFVTQAKKYMKVPPPATN